MSNLNIRQYQILVNALLSLICAPGKHNSCFMLRLVLTTAQITFHVIFGCFIKNAKSTF